MNKEFYQLYKNVKYNWCSSCDSGECRNCYVDDILKQIEELDASLNNNSAVEEGCFVCQDKKGKNQDVFYFDKANNMRDSKFCPNCGRKISI